MDCLGIISWLHTHEWFINSLISCHAALLWLSTVREQGAHNHASDLSLLAKRF